MRDEMFSRDWVDNHETFSRDLERGFARLRLSLSRFFAWDGSTAHLLALVASVAITSLTFNNTAV